MTKGLIVGSLALAGALMMTAPADAQRRKVATKAPKSGAETGLIGVKLFDSGVRVVQIYGNPDSIEAVGVAAGNTPGGGDGGGRGGFGGPGGSGGGGRGGRAPLGAPSLDFTGPGDFGGVSDLPEADRQGGPPQGGEAGPSGGGGGRPSGPPLGGPGGPGGPGGGAPGGGATAETADYIRWVYNKSGAKFGFIMDKFNRVVQIEAIGLQNQRVKTKRGISFGSTFASVIKAYAPSAAPDSYVVAGDTVTVKFITRQRVAFRLSKLTAKAPHVVTGIVVAAGKG